MAAVARRQNKVRVLDFFIMFSRDRHRGDPFLYNS
jgi:hypothetical protein